MTSETQTTGQGAVETMIELGPHYAKAKARRVYLEQFRKTKKALLMGQSEAKTVADREAFAYSHSEYIEVLQGLEAAVEAEIDLEWKLKAAQARIDIWRTKQANNRALEGNTR